MLFLRWLFCGFRRADHKIEHCRQIGRLVFDSLLTSCQAASASTRPFLKSSKLIFFLPNVPKSIIIFSFTHHFWIIGAPRSSRVSDLFAVIMWTRIRFRWPTHVRQKYDESGYIIGLRYSSSTEWQCHPRRFHLRRNKRRVERRKQH